MQKICSTLGTSAHTGACTVQALLEVEDLGAVGLDALFAPRTPEEAALHARILAGLEAYMVMIQAKRQRPHNNGIPALRKPAPSTRGKAAAARAASGAPPRSAGDLSLNTCLFGFDTIQYQKYCLCLA